MIDLDFEASFSEPVTAALGFFDCVHLGHKRIIREVLRMAEANRTLPAVFTFRGDLTPRKEAKKLTVSYRDRLNVFESMGVKAVISARFDDRFAAMSPCGFLDKLSDRFVLEGLACGEDYRFGRGARGTPETLRKFCERRKLAFSCLPLLEEGGVKISSTEIRRLLAEGDIEAVNRLLGRTFFRTGRVVEGHHVGERIGIRTANVDFGELAEIGDGVYGTQTLAEGRLYRSVTFVGTSETFSRTAKTVECHIPGFEGDLYGKSIRIGFLKKLRDNRKFETFEALVAQIGRDIQAALPGEGGAEIR